LSSIKRLSHDTQSSTGNLRCKGRMHINVVEWSIVVAIVAIEIPVRWHVGNSEHFAAAGRQLRASIQPLCPSENSESLTPGTRQNSTVRIVSQVLAQTCFWRLSCSSSAPPGLSWNLCVIWACLPSQRCSIHRARSRVYRIAVVVVVLGGLAQRGSLAVYRRRVHHPRNQNRCEPYANLPW
jgi:hypothetical protein